MRRENTKIEEFRKLAEAKNRRIVELEDQITNSQKSILLTRSFSYYLFYLIFSAMAEQEQTQAKKMEMLRAKLALETKLKEDIQSLKMRLESDLDEAERVAEDEGQKRKRFETENWTLRAELDEIR